MRNFIKLQFDHHAVETAGSNNMDEQKGETPIVHHVLFWLKNAGSETERQLLISGLQTLSGIPEIKKMYIGFPATTEERGVVDASYDVSELFFFDNLADQAIYQAHPLHQAFIEKHNHLWSKVVVYDMLAI